MALVPGRSVRSRIWSASTASIPPIRPGSLEACIQAWIQQFFVDKGIEVSLVDVYPGRPNLLATLPGRDRSRRLLLEAHVDTAGIENMTYSAV